MTKLSEKVALITGGNGGIGLAVAKLFVAEGAKVVVTGRRQDVLAAAAAEIGGGATGITADVANLADHDRLLSEVRRLHGALDIYMANAGVNELVPFGNVTEDQFDSQFGVNVRGLFFGVQKALPLMREGGSIILTGSIAGTKVFPGHNVYAATKAAIRALAKNWAVDLKSRQIRVNVLSPGPVETPILAKLGIGPANVEAIADAIPLGRLGRPEELAKAALFLASSDSSFVTGIDLCVDGGIGQI